MRHARFFTALVAGLLLGSSAHAATNLVFNGGFESVRGGVYGHPTVTGLANDGNASLWAPNGGAYTDSAAVGWSVTAGSLGRIFAEDGLSNAAKYGYYGYYGPSQNYGTSYLLYTDKLGTDPDGGNFVGFDGDHYGGALSQVINGLTVGQGYTLTFYQASDHYQGWGDTQTSQFRVSLGHETYFAPTMTPTLTNPVPWSKVTMYFTADSTSETLSFLNAGGGAPPFALLDGVSLTAGVPEPATWTLMILAFGMVGGALRRRRERGLTAGL